MIGVPCFTVHSEQEKDRDMLCSSSIHEKEMWLQVMQTIKILILPFISINYF